MSVWEKERGLRGVVVRFAERMLESPSGFLKRTFGSLLEPVIRRRVDLAVAAMDWPGDRLISRDTYPRDRHDFDRMEVLKDALEAWRVNPLARRIVELTSQYVVGGGVNVETKHERTNKFLQRFWDHRLNRMAIRTFEWSDELSRAGDLFVTLATDAGGMSYVRAVPAADILEIETKPNDIEQELVFWERPRQDGKDLIGPHGLAGRRWSAYDESADGPGPGGGFEPVMLHYAINKPVGAKFGESDLAPLLRWLARYANWLEDRVRLNRFRNTFLFWVKAQFNSKEERLARQAELNQDPPSPGSILVTDESETWEVLSPKLESSDAEKDGLAIKKMIAGGSGNPLHFLAEPESATRTTAESAGGPTFRHYQQRQIFFTWLLQDICQIAIRRRKMVDRLIDPEAEVKVTATDISARDNTALAAAASEIIAAFQDIRDRGLIDDQELLRVAYRFAGEVVDVEEMLTRGAKAPEPKVPQAKRAGKGVGVLKTGAVVGPGGSEADANGNGAA